jgi:hypothetical protein
VVFVTTLATSTLKGFSRAKWRRTATTGCVQTD